MKLSCQLRPWAAAELMKIGAGVVVTTLASQATRAAKTELAQDSVTEGKGSTTGSKAPQRGKSRRLAARVRTGPGYKNDSGRNSGNGPMDNTSRQLVSYVTSFSESNLDVQRLLTGMSKIMLDATSPASTGRIRIGACTNRRSTRKDNTKRLQKYNPGIWRGDVARVSRRVY